MIFDDNFAYFFIKTYVVGAQNRLGEAMLMSTHNIGFYGDLTKLSLNYHQIRTLFLLLASSVHLHTLISACV